MRYTFLFTLCFFISTGFSEEKSRNGLGFDFGARIFYPLEINEFLEEKYEYMQEGYILLSEIGTSNMISGYGLTLKGAISPVRGLIIEPFGNIFWGGKLLSINSDNSWTHFLDYTGGVNLYGQFKADKVVSPKLGAGIYGGYSQFFSQKWGIEMSGLSKGINILSGLDITFKKIVVTITFKVPIGITELELDSIDEPLPEDIKLPKRVGHVGLEIKPGIIFRF